MSKEEESDSISTRTRSQEQPPVITLEQANDILQSSSDSITSLSVSGSEGGDIEPTTQQYDRRCHGAVFAL